MAKQKQTQLIGYRGRDGTLYRLDSTIRPQGWNEWPNWEKERNANVFKRFSPATATEFLAALRLMGMTGKLTPQFIRLG